MAAPDSPRLGPAFRARPLLSLPLSLSPFVLLFLLLLLPSLLLLAPSSALEQCSGPGAQCASDGTVGAGFEYVAGAGPGLEAPKKVAVDGEKLLQVIDHLSTLSDDPAPAVTRIVYTENDVAARKYVKELMSAAGLSIREDAVGNIFGRWEGSEPELGAILTGSHTDAIPLAGKYDGVLGVVGGIAALQALRAAGFRPRRSLEVLMFTSEEPTRFGLSCLGSRLMASQEGFAAKLRRATDRWGQNIAGAAEGAGYKGLGDGDDAMASVSIAPGNYSAFVELHIEQGKVLEDQGVSIGVVSHIAGPAALHVEFSGSGGHAGGLLMPLRNDAGLAAAELALAVESAVLDTQSIDTVGTTGHVSLEPNAINSVPRKAHVEIDVRDTDGPRRDRVVAQIEKSARAIAERRKVTLDKFEVVNADPPATCSPRVLGAIEKSADELGLSRLSLPSRAYHDSLFMARIAPTAMIFIPCRLGVSHRPDEFASVEDMKNGVQVLALTMAKLSLLD